MHCHRNRNLIRDLINKCTVTVTNPQLEEKLDKSQKSWQKSHMSLLKFFDDHNPNFSATPAERSAISKFENLTPEPKWRPSNPYLGGFLPIIEIGLLADILKNTKNAEKNAQAAITAFIEKDPKLESKLSELHIGAFLVKCSNTVAYIDRIAGSRTPDLTVVTSKGIIIDVEVAVAEEKQNHSVLKSLLLSLTEAIGPRTDRNYAIYIVPPLNNEICMEICDAIIKTAIGATHGASGSWHLVVGPIEARDNYTGGEGLRELQPDWWTDGPAFRVVSTIIGNENTNHAPVLSIVSSVPMELYVNPVKRKAERPQRSGDYTYLVGLVTSHLPGAHIRLPAEIEAWESN
jgi:hypothetical protein